MNNMTPEQQIAFAEKVVSFWKNYQKNHFDIKSPKMIVNSTGPSPVINLLGGTFIIDEHMLIKGELPVKINNCYDIRVITDKLLSFKNFPQEFHVLTLQEKLNSNFSFEYFPENIQNVYVQKDKNLLKNLDEKIKKCEIKILFVNGLYKGPLLSVLKCNIKKIESYSTSSKAFDKATKIINDYITDTAKNKNIWKCQDELQDADLDVFADL